MIKICVAYTWGEICTRCGRKTMTRTADNGRRYCGPCGDVLCSHGLAVVEGAPPK